MKKLFLSVILIIGSVGLYAQSTTPELPSGVQGTQPGSIRNHSAPIDGGFSILLFLGAAYGTKKIFQLKKKVEI